MLKDQMRNEAKGEKALRITLRCRVADVHHASSGKSRPVCAPLAPRATVLDTEVWRNGVGEI